MARSRREIAYLAAGAGVITGLTAIYRSLHPVANPTTVSLSFLFVILLVATRCGLWVAIATASVAAICFNFFFLPPFGTFTIQDADNWVALFVFLVVGIVASNLSSAARARAQEAIARRDEVTRLFDLRIDFERHRVVRGEEEIRLTPKEFELLAFLARYPGRVLTHRTILKAIWGAHAVISPSTCEFSWRRSGRKSSPTPRNRAIF